jgi:kinesin family protein C1
MLGGRRSDGSDDEGIIGRSIRKMFSEKREVEALSRGSSQVAISVELLEVYNEKVRDLLSPEIHQDLKVTSNHDVVGNIVVETKSEHEVLKVLEIAQSRRCTKATDSNSESSRSHMVFTLHFVVTDISSQGNIQRAGKLHICDLAGSERLYKSGVSGGALLEESKNINKSLSVLSNVIERLQNGDKNIPFRESKLTFLLQNSLRGNNAKTLAIVCCHGSSEHFNESLGSLRFAEKVNRVELKQQTGNVRS